MKVQNTATHKVLIRRMVIAGGGSGRLVAIIFGMTGLLPMSKVTAQSVTVAAASAMIMKGFALHYG